MEVTREIVLAAPREEVWAALTESERLGVHPYMRLRRPPRDLLRYEPDHLLVGHGAGLHGPAAARELHRAIRQSAWRAPLLPFSLIPRR